MATRKRKPRPSKVIAGKVHVKAYTRKPGKLPKRNAKGRFTGKGQQKLF